MFYEEFIKLCNEKNIKPTPALKEMGLSTANMQRWKDDEEAITLKKLKTISNYFNVPISRILGEEDKMNIHQENVKNENTNIGYNNYEKENGIIKEIVEELKELEKVEQIEILKYIIEKKQKCNVKK